MSGQFKDAKNANESYNPQYHYGLDVGLTYEVVQIERYDGPKVYPVHWFLQKLEFSRAENQPNDKLKCKPSYTNDIGDVKGLKLRRRFVFKIRDALQTKGYHGSQN